MEENNKLSLPEAKGLCPECSKKYERYEDKYLFAYCPHNKAGGTFFLEKQTWTINTPISLEQHKKVIDGLIQADKAYETYHSQHTDETFH